MTYIHKRVGTRLTKVNATNMKTVLSDSKKVTDQGCLTNSLLINYKTNNDISMRSSYHGNVDPVKKGHSCCIIPLARNFK